MLDQIREFTFRPKTFLAGAPAFVRTYFATRRWLLLLAMSPWLLLSIFLVFSVFPRDVNRQQLLQHYTRLSHSAVAAGQLPSAEVYFAKVMALSGQSKELSLDFANRLLAGAEGGSESKSLATRRRAIQLLGSLAPNDRPGYRPAHEALTVYWNDQQPQTEMTRLMVLRHRMFSQPEDVDRVIELAAFIGQRGYHRQATELLAPHQQPNALLASAKWFAMDGDRESSGRCIRKAMESLTATLKAKSGDVSARLLLSQIVAARGEILASLLLLAEGIDIEASDQLADELVHQYSAWLSTMSPATASAQLKEIELALNGGCEPAGQKSKRQAEPERGPELALIDIQLSDKTTAQLPATIGRLHQALLDGQGRWLMPLLLGTDKATRGDFDQAAEHLELAAAESPDNSVVANNLAWTLLQRSISPSSQSGRNSAELQRAWELSSVVVKNCPNNVSFRETRGTIAFELGYWDIAAADLQFCSDAGHVTRSVELHLKEAVTRSATPND